MVIATALTAFIVMLALIPPLRWVSYRYQFMLDYPSFRRIHKEPVPRIGGIAMTVALVLAVTIGFAFSGEKESLRSLVAILIAGGVAALIGMRDDLRSMKAYQKFMGQVIVTVVLVASGLRIERMVFPFYWDVPLHWPVSFMMTLFWVTATMNAINLIDGMDGSAAGLSLIASLSMGFLAYRTNNTLALLLSVGIAGMCLSFLCYNFPPASVFMGDCGSMFLGATFAGTSLLLTHNGATTGSLWIPIIILTVPFLDTLLAILRRKLRGQSILVADREHLHHQLLGFGLSQRQTILVFYTIAVLVNILGIACFYWTDAEAMSAIAAVGLMLLAVGLIMTHQYRKRVMSNTVHIAGAKQKSLHTDRG